MQRLLHEDGPVIRAPGRTRTDPGVNRQQAPRSRNWPGGLTLVFEAGPRTPGSLTAGTGKIGVRLSSHPIATGLAQSAGLPITGTSANVSGEPACIKAEEVSRSLGRTVDLILDGGETEGGKGSTILDITVKPPRVLREGMVSREDLKTLISL